MDRSFRFGPWRVEPGLNTVARNGTILRLEPKMMNVLVCLAEHAGEAVSKEKLLEAVWPGTFVSDDVLFRSISELRRIFEDDVREPTIIQTIPRRGYRLIAPVEWVNGATESGARHGPEAGRTAPVNTRKFWTRALTVVAAALLFAVLGASVGGLRARLASKSGTPQIKSLAVLPLQNLSDDPSQEYFADGMTDALIIDLSHVGSLKVISRTSTMRYKKTEKSLPQIARELNVDGVIEGTVQRSGDRVRITAQLIHGPTDKHVWANSYERDLRDVFALERDVTEDITRQVRAQIDAPDRKPWAESRSTNPQALEAYLQGNYHLHKFARGFGDEEQKKAAECFQQSIGADPNFALAYLGLANAHTVMWSSSHDAEIAKQSVEKAVKLDPALSEARMALGDIKASNWDWSGAEQDYRRAIELSPNNAQAHVNLGNILEVTGRKDEALRECETGQELDPSQDNLSLELYFHHDYDRAISIARIVLQSDPDNAYVHGELFRYYAAKGMPKESVQELETAATLIGFPKTADRIRRAFTESGYQRAVQQWAKELEVLAATKEVYAPINSALAHAIIGDKDRAFYWLEQVYRQHDLQQVTQDMTLEEVVTDPLFAPLRDDPRYHDLLRRIGLPQ